MGFNRDSFVGVPSLCRDQLFGGTLPCALSKIPLDNRGWTIAVDIRDDVFRAHVLGGSDGGGDGRVSQGGPAPRPPLDRGRAFYGGILGGGLTAEPAIEKKS